MDAFAVGDNVIIHNTRTPSLYCHIGQSGVITDIAFGLYKVSFSDNQYVGWFLKTELALPEGAQLTPGNLAGLFNKVAEV